jgi:hypothetical protein
MERGKTMFVITLNTCSCTLSTNIAGKFPSTFWYVFNVINRFHINAIAHTDFRNPDGAKQVRPLVGIGLLESATFIGTK